jgi:hypothetical protein
MIFDHSSSISHVSFISKACGKLTVFFLRFDRHQSASVAPRGMTSNRNTSHFSSLFGGKGGGKSGSKK